MKLLLDIGLAAVVVWFAVYLFRLDTRTDDTKHPGVQRWLTECARVLRGTLEGPAVSGEFGQFVGASGGIPWRIRVISGFQRTLVSDAVHDEHHLFWFTDAVQTRDIRAVLGDGSDAATLRDWRFHPGLTPNESKRRFEASAARMSGIADRVIARANAAKELTLIEGDPGRELDAMFADVGLPIERDAMAEFAETARFVRLDPAVADVGWHAFAVDDAAECVLRSRGVQARLVEWKARELGGREFLRVWMGGPNLRIEVYGFDLPHDAYRSVVELGTELARGYLRVAEVVK